MTEQLRAWQRGDQLARHAGSSLAARGAGDRHLRDRDARPAPAERPTARADGVVDMTRDRRRSVQRHRHPPHPRDAAGHGRGRGGRRAEPRRPDRQPLAGDGGRAAGQRGGAVPAVGHDVQPGRLRRALPCRATRSCCTSWPIPCSTRPAGRRRWSAPSCGRCPGARGLFTADQVRQAVRPRGALHAPHAGAFDRADGQHRGWRVLAAGADRGGLRGGARGRTGVSHGRRPADERRGRERARRPARSRGRSTASGSI